MKNHQDSSPGSPDLIDRRLRRVFGSLDTSTAFEAQVLARVRVHAYSVELQSRVAADREWQLYRERVAALGRWRRVALRILTLDALAVGAVLTVVIVALMQSQTELIEGLQSSASLIPAKSMPLFGTVLGVVLGLAPILMLRFRR